MLILLETNGAGQLRLPIDAFFDGIVVNDDDPAIRLNRLGLLAVIREKMLMVADFSKIEARSEMTKWVYNFGKLGTDGESSMRNLLGGKGANLLK